MASKKRRSRSSRKARGVPLTPLAMTKPMFFTFKFTTQKRADDFAAAAYAMRGVSSESNYRHFVNVACDSPRAITSVRRLAERFDGTEQPHVVLPDDGWFDGEGHRARARAR